MLFVLDDQLLPYCEGAGGPEIDGIQNLLSSIRQGLHAVAGSHSLFSALARNQTLSVRERATATKLANRRSELPLLIQNVHRKISVDANMAANSPRRINNFCWGIRAVDLKTKFLNSSTLLAENMLDAELFQLAAKHYQILRKLNGLVAKSVPRGGGGSQIDVELKSLLNQGLPVISVTDGDLTFPGTQKSPVTKKCEAAILSAFGVGWHVAIPAREIENIIPHSVLQAVSDPKIGPLASDDIAALKAIGNRLGSNPCDYICLKKGLGLGEIFACVNSEEKEYWASHAKEIKDSRSVYFSTCLDNMACDRKPCICSVARGYGENVLFQVKKWADERGPHESLKSFSASTTWLEIGEMVFEASLAFKAESV